MATLSSHTRLIALVGALVAAAAAIAAFMLLRSPDSSASDGVDLRAALTPLPAAEKRPAAVKDAAVTQEPVVAANGLPSVLAQALRRHRVVVVMLYASDAPLDGMVRAEARAGARDVGAGFVAVNVLDRTHSEPLALMTGVVEAPGTLVFRRPGKLVSRLDGFADRVAVAQAAANAGA